MLTSNVAGVPVVGSYLAPRLSTSSSNAVSGGYNMMRKSRYVDNWNKSSERESNSQVDDLSIIVLPNNVNNNTNST